MYRTFFKTSTHLFFSCVLLFVAATAVAWEQPTHRQINYEALKVFWRSYAISGMEKYKKGVFPKSSLTTSYRGIGVTSTGLRQSDYTKEEKTLKLGNWIVYGGDCADEPHLYASVRHFYDPFSKWGQTYLTDQSEVHGWYDDPQTDARSWGLSHGDNPFCFNKALQYYKKALEVDEDNFQITLDSHWKTDVSFSPANAEEARSIWLGLAYRALGETMHMLADMTQPAHVRNDSHPLSEPIESNIKPSDVTHAAAVGVVDSRIANSLMSAGGQLQIPDQLFKKVATFTNMYFYSADTIFDEEDGVIPTNTSYEDYALGIKVPYDRPQFKNLIKEERTIKGFLFDRTTKRFYGAFTNEKTPMTQERLSFHWFDPDKSVKEKIADHAVGVGPYQIPPSYAFYHRYVLIPVATHACADLMHLFFPTMEVVSDFSDPESEEGDGYTRMVMDLDAEMKHLQTNDPAWTGAGLSVAYTGPGKLIFADSTSITKTRDILFKDGVIQKIKNSVGDMVEEPLRVYIAAGTPLNTEEAYYEAFDGDKLYVQVEAGSRIFKSEEYEVDTEIEVTIVGGDVNYEMVEGETEYEHTFTATASPEGDYVYEWDFGNGSTASDTPGNRIDSEVSNKYEDGIFAVTVDLYSPGGSTPLASDSITITIIEQLREYELNVCDTWMASQGGGYGTTVDVWDISELPDGTIFDIQFDAYSVPDKFVVQYAGGTALDTGWRGSTSDYDSNPELYPGGLSGPGAGSADGIFTKSAENSFRVVVYGPHTSTGWAYSIRANCP